MSRQSKFTHGYVYVLTNLITQDEYVGKSQRWRTRWKNHIKAAKDGGANVLYRAMRKYGVENFAITIIRRCTLEDLDRWEVYYIEKFVTLLPFGYNMTEGGDGGTMSETVIDKMRTAQRARFKAHPVSVDTREKLAEKSRGRKVSDRTRDLISASETGKFVSAATCKKLCWTRVKRARYEAAIRKRHKEGRRIKPYWAWNHKVKSQ